jgi:hypothetical protein
MARLPHGEPVLEMAGAGAGVRNTKDSGIIEID